MTVDQFFYATWQAQLDAWDARQGNQLIVVAPVNGDFNRDGVVDASDYVVWRKNGGTQQAYDTWRKDFGATIGGGSLSNATDAAVSDTTVPEPTALALVLISATLCTTSRRRKL
jgi:hypothetical protein